MKQVYVIVRFDRFQLRNVDVVDCLKVKKVVTSPERAKAEVERLNAINGGDDVVYFFAPARFEEESVGD